MRKRGLPWSPGACRVALLALAMAFPALAAAAPDGDSDSLVGDTLFSGVSSGTAESGSSFTAVTCDRGGNLYCDGSVTKTSSSGCGLCP